MVWQNFVHDQFQNRTSPSDARQRHLALDLGALRDWVDASKVAELTPRLAKAYATKTTKTVSRDIQALVQLKLVERVGRRIRANREIIFGFLPLRRTSTED